ncbi:adenylate/guanylate cyclase domain-containing protein [Flavobacterium gelatinilyticum]|uniref:adenylate/guanylate cyclase domain-containing protein n=1 Tax=Flavobacterium gelatinilyticum TaxID=3003260 RepID=UPI0024806984|nr:adenylate/guanylate cyclase domain-containing protein [Flavobacterium gelatinilyticum]
MPFSAFRLRYYYQEIFHITLLWIITGLLFVYIKFNDLHDLYICSNYPFPAGTTKSRIYAFSLASSFVIGLMMALLHTLVYPRLIRTHNLLITAGLRSLVFCILAIVLLLLFFGESPYRFSANLTMQSAAADITVYLIFIETLIGMTVTLRRSLGKNYYRNFIRSTYFTPALENRVFMFMDLKNSTESVERMGSIAFSSFIQDCFKDLCEQAMDYGGEIYQFVGDEAVITWPAAHHFDYSLSLELHFALKARLADKEKQYLDRHDNFPCFRSSVHCGEVSAALVGRYKQEIAYHGGVLNLCSRMQSMCRDYDIDLVISEKIHQQLSISSSRFSFKAMDGLCFKGIEKKQLAYSVSLPSKGRLEPGCRTI